MPITSRRRSAPERIYTVKYNGKPVFLGRHGQLKGGETLHLKESEYKPILNDARFELVSGPIDGNDWEMQQEKAALKAKLDKANAEKIKQGEADEAAKRELKQGEQMKKAPPPLEGEGAELKPESVEDLPPDLRETDLTPPAGKRTRTKPADKE